jgi:RNA polymerase I specific initiation factor
MAHRQWHGLYEHSPSFLFASPDGEVPSTARKVHIRRLFDILHLSIQRGDLPHARRAFGLLARCGEIEWMAIWKVGLLLLAQDSESDGDALATARHIDFLRVMMLQHPEQVRASLTFLFAFHFATPSPPSTSSVPEDRFWLTNPLLARITYTGTGAIAGRRWTGTGRSR